MRKTYISCLAGASEPSGVGAVARLLDIIKSFYIDPYQICLLLIFRLR
jgi:hypothetical protein